MLIYPEGRRFTPERRARAIALVPETDPARADWPYDVWQGVDACGAPMPFREWRERVESGVQPGASVNARVVS